MSLSKENKYPEIRFKGFTEAWEQRKFFDNIETTIDFRGRTPKKLGLDWSEKGYLALSALNVKNGFIDPKADAHYGNQTLYNKWMGGRELRKGQVLFTTEAPMGNVAQVPDDQGYILSQRTIAFEVKKDKMTDDFLAFLLRSPKAFNDLTSLSSGGTAKGVSQKSLSHFKVIVPIDLEEQQKIGSLFKQLDNTIALHQCKLDRLENLKKAYLQVLLPNIEEKTPKMRFTNFNESWEQRKLEDISTYIRGSFPQPYTNPKFYDEKDGKPFVQVADIGFDLKLNADTKAHISKLAEPKSRFVKAGKVIVALQGSIEKSIGRTAITQYDAYFDRTILIFEDYKIPVDKQYFAQVIKALFEREKERAWGATISTITKKHLNNFIIGVPSIEEQKQIGMFFKQLDNNIALHQEKLDKLFILKKAYLKMMFI